MLLFVFLCLRLGNSAEEMSNATSIMPTSQTNSSFTFTGLDPGGYQVIVAAVAGEVMGEYSEPYSFEISK